MYRWLRKPTRKQGSGATLLPESYHKAKMPSAKGHLFEQMCAFAGAWLAHALGEERKAATNIAPSF
jgi:hypothetical protein